MLVFSSWQLHYKWFYYKWFLAISLHEIASELYIQSFNYSMRIVYIFAKCFSLQRTNFMYKKHYLCNYLCKNWGCQKRRNQSQLKHTTTTFLLATLEFGKNQHSSFTKTFPSVMNNFPSAPYGKRNSELKNDVKQKT